MEKYSMWHSLKDFALIKCHLEWGGGGDFVLAVNLVAFRPFSNKMLVTVVHVKENYCSSLNFEWMNEPMNE